MTYSPVILGAILVIVGLALIISHILEVWYSERADVDPKGPFGTPYPGLFLIVIGAVMFIVGR